MKKLILFLLGLIIFTTKTQAQQYSIANWYNNKQACAVLTYDDWLEGQGEIVFNQLISRNMVATFFVNSDWANRGGGYDTMMYGVKHGMEIANHTASHSNLTSIILDSAKFQIKSSFDSISKYVTNQKCLTFAYPFGSYDSDIIDYLQNTSIGARTVYGNWYWNNNWIYDFTNLSNDYSTMYKPYYEISTYEITTNASVLDISAQLDNAVSNGGLVTFLMHEIYNNSFGNSNGFDHILDTYHAQILDNFSNYNTLWISTFADAIKYHKERNCATLSTVNNTNQFWTLQLSDTLYNNSIYNHPLTVQLQVPPYSAFDSITQNGIKINNFTLSNNQLTFNAVPDAGNIIIYKAYNNEVENIQSKNLLSEAYPNPVLKDVTLVLNSSEDVNINIYNQLGEKVYSTVSNVNGFSKINIDCSALAAGIYNISVTGKNSSSSIKISKID